MKLPLSSKIRSGPKCHLLVCIQHLHPRKRIYTVKSPDTSCSKKTQFHVAGTRCGHISCLSRCFKPELCHRISGDQRCGGKAPILSLSRVDCQSHCQCHLIFIRAWVPPSFYLECVVSSTSQPWTLILHPTPQIITNMYFIKSKRLLTSNAPLFDATLRKNIPIK